MRETLQLRGAIALLVGLAIAAPARLATAEPKGILTGIVVNESSGSPVPEAAVSVEGTGLATKTDLRGLFRLDVDPGSRIVLVTARGFKPSKVTDVVLEAGRVQNIGVVLEPTGGSSAGAITGTAGLATSAEVFVTVRGSDSTEEALLVERRAAAEVSDNIGAREMTKGSVSTAASAVQRVVGVSLVDDKYVFVRGLGERYSSTRLNGTLIPSTEPEKKVVPLDLFPSSLLEKVTVAKSYSPDKPGEFAGGLVDLKSTDFPPTPFIGLTLGGINNDGTTGEAFGEYAGGLETLGKGGQPAPASLPEQLVIRGNPATGTGFTPTQLQEIGRSFGGTWQGVQKDAPFNLGGSMNLAGTFGNLGVLVSGTYSRPFKYQEEKQARYATTNEGLVLRNDFDYRTSEESVKQGLLANLGWKLGDSGRLSLRGFMTDTSSTEYRIVDYFDDDTGADQLDRRGKYTNEQILAGQGAGEHYLEGFLGSGTFVDWKVAYSRGTREEDVRQTLYFVDPTTGVYTFAEESQSGFLLFDGLTDRILEGNLDLTTTTGSNEAPITLKYGAAWNQGDREFSARRFRFRPRGSVDRTLLPDELLSEANIGPTGMEIGEETRPTDSYDGSSEILAGYAMAEVATGSWRLLGGARVENAQIRVKTFDQFALDPTVVESVLDDTDVLPAVSVIYQLGSKANVRAAFSQTVNRPQFRELAPFEFTEISEGRATIGNPDLQRATIRNYDVRWELFPSGREVLAFSLFYKELKDPIEQTLEATANLRTTYQNVEGARNFGGEVEARVNFGTFAQSLSALTLIANYTYVDSKVDIGDKQGILTSRERALQGQSDHVANGTLELAPIGTGLSLQLFVNYTGARISDVGSFGLPDIVEAARTTVDVTWSQDLNFLVPGLGFKLAASNLTDAEVRFTQGGLPQRTFTEGRRYGLQLKYRFDM
jgi:hypothetical protein